MIYSGIPKKRRAEPEFQSQCALIAWSRNPAVLSKYPGIDLLSCSLNGVKLSKAQAGKAKAAGMLKGEYDLKLPIARGPYIGLAIEMKAGRNKPTEEQVWYGTRLGEEGWHTAVHWDWESAKDEIERYMRLGPSNFFVVRGSIPAPSV